MIRCNRKWPFLRATKLGSVQENVIKTSRTSNLCMDVMVGVIHCIIKVMKNANEQGRWKKTYYNYVRFYWWI